MRELTSQQPQGEVRHHQRREDNYQRRQRRHQRREDSHQRQRRLRLQKSHQRQETTLTEEPSTTEDCVGVSCVPEHYYYYFVIVNKVVPEHWYCNSCQ